MLLVVGCASSGAELGGPFVSGGGDAGQAQGGADAVVVTVHGDGGSGATGDASVAPRDAGVLSRDAGATPMDAGVTPPSDAHGKPDVASAVDAGDPYNTPVMCSSGTMWTLGNTKSAEMNPGQPCDTCHFLGGSASGYEFDVAGTVYATAHEPNNCNGATGASVVVTDSSNAVHTLAVNAAGNFYNFDYLGVGAIPTPYTVKVVANGKERAMLTPLTTGDCNSCHTEQGAQNAPGRVMMP